MSAEAAEQALQIERRHAETSVIFKEMWQHINNKNNNKSNNNKIKTKLTTPTRTRNITITTTIIISTTKTLNNITKTTTIPRNQRQNYIAMPMATESCQHCDKQQQKKFAVAKCSRAITNNKRTTTIATATMPCN